jgi:hypothetical protein
MDGVVEPQTRPVPNKHALAAVDAIEDEFGGRVTVAANDGRVVLRGWALDAGARAFAAIEIGIGGARAAAPCTIVRPDVAATFGSPDEVGFSVELALDDARVGHHAVELRGRRADGAHVAIPVAAAVDVVHPLRRLPRGVVAGALVGFVDEVRDESAPPDAAAADPVVVPVDGAVIVRGWAASAAGAPATAAYAEIDGERLLRGMCGHPRPDAAAQFGAARTDYGFRIRLAGQELGRGEHTVRVRAVAGDAVAAIGRAVRVSVGPPASSRVFQPSGRERGHVELIGRFDGGTTMLEERSVLRLHAGERAVVTGWAGDVAGSELPGRVMLVVDGVAHGPVQRGLDRPDVADAQRCEGLRTSGFCAVIRADGLAAGFHRAELVALYGAEPVVLDAFSFEVSA